MVIKILHSFQNRWIITIKEFSYNVNPKNSQFIKYVV